MKLSTVLFAATLASGVGVAQAEETTVLSAADMDKVTAGDYYYPGYGYGSVNVNYADIYASSSAYTDASKWYFVYNDGNISSTATTTVTVNQSIGH
ncbi:hypothetical protein [Candidatus Methylocalor cossyra]|uniref:Uncharacterized protein n=1 Tax=Candidatus Methylocalor cossyra TaxID=3108543 RepID=A0ABP1C4E8_9GAMM